MSGRPPMAWDRQAAACLTRAGLSVAAISEALGRPKSTIGIWMSRDKVRSRPGWRRLERAVELAQRMSALRASKAVGVSYAKLTKELRRRGLAPLGPQKAPTCTSCGGPNERKGSCRECERKRWRTKNSMDIPSRTAKARSEERRRAKERQGRSYHTRAERKVITQERQKARLAAKQARQRRGPTAIQQLAARYLAENPNYDPPSDCALRYRARYTYDEAFRVQEIRRRHVQRNEPHLRDDGTLTPAVLRALFAAAKRCPDCLQAMRSKQKSLDHIVPKSRGGAHSIFNVRVICLTCNVRKHATMPDQLTLGSEAA